VNAVSGKESKKKEEEEGIQKLLRVCERVAKGIGLKY
jgi:hypothetical protein